MPLFFCCINCEIFALEYTVSTPNSTIFLTTREDLIEYDVKEIGSMIRILLSTRLGERKWTQADLVRETGIRASTINDLYHEMTDRVSLEQLDQICKALDCDINEILVREEKIDERTRQRMGPAPERRK